MKLTEAIILAGGLGTRLRSVVKTKPKSMALINDRPFLEYLLDDLLAYGVKRFIFSVGYKAHFITDHFGKSYRGCEIVYAEEKEPLGTGGAIKHAFQYVRSADVLVVNGDSLFRVDIRQQYQFHLKKQADLTLALKPMTKFERYGTVELDAEDRILNFREKQSMDQGLINGGVYIFKTKTFKELDFPTKFSLEKDFFEPYAKQLQFYGFQSQAYFLDIGIPSDFAKAQEEFKVF